MQKTKIIEAADTIGLCTWEWVMGNGSWCYFGLHLDMQGMLGAYMSLRENVWRIIPYLWAMLFRVKDQRSACCTVKPTGRRQYTRFLVVNPTGIKSVRGYLI